MKATLKPTDQPGTFGIVIDDITVEEAETLLDAIRFCAPVSSSANCTLRPVLETGIAAVEGKE